MIPGRYVAEPAYSCVIRFSGKTDEGQYLQAYLSIDGLMRYAAEIVMEKGIWKKR